MKIYQYAGTALRRNGITRVKKCSNLRHWLRWKDISARLELSRGRLRRRYVLLAKLALISSPALRFRVASGPLFEYLLMHKIPTDALKN